MNPCIKKKILVLTSTFPRWEGDSEPPFVYELCKRLQTHYQLTVLAPHAPNAATRELMCGIEVIRFKYCIPGWQTLSYQGGILPNLKKNPLNYFLIPFFIFFQLVSTLRILNKSEIETIHAHWLIPQGLVAVIARIFTKRKIHIMCTSHGGDLFALAGRCMTRLKTRIIRELDKLIVVSNAMLVYVQHMAPDSKVEVVSMGVDLIHQFKPLSHIQRDPYTVLYVGRLVEKKGINYLIRAMPKILELHPKTILLIAGDGPERSKLQGLVTSLNLTSSIKFLGPVLNSDLPQLYNKASVLAVPSIVTPSGDQEGLGLVSIEAMGCSCPVVASDLPAIEDVIIDGITGLICREKDSADLAEKICTLFNDPRLSQRLQQQGRQYVVDRYDWTVVTNKYISLIERGCSTIPGSQS